MEEEEWLHQIDSRGVLHKIHRYKIQSLFLQNHVIIIYNVLLGISGILFCWVGDKQTYLDDQRSLKKVLILPNFILSS